MPYQARKDMKTVFEEEWKLLNALTEEEIAEYAISTLQLQMIVKNSVI